MKKGELKEVYKEYSEFVNYAKQKNLKPEEIKILSDIHQQRQIAKATRYSALAAGGLVLLGILQLIKELEGAEAAKSLIINGIQVVVAVLFLGIILVTGVNIIWDIIGDIYEWVKDKIKKRKRDTPR
jgi:hypothetical protein